MEKLLSQLINSFIQGAADTISFFLKDLVQVGLYAERNLDVITATNSTINFTKLFDICRGFGISLLILIFLKKGFETYILATSGDPDRHPLAYLKDFIIALIIIVCFPIFYDILADITTDLANTLIFGVEVTQIKDPNIFTAIISIITNSIFSVIAGLIAVILYIVLYIQFIVRGLEILIMRIGFPLSVTGLLSSDRGSFAPFVKKFLQNALTIVVQVVLAKMAILFILCSNLLYGIASLILALKTPKFIQEFLVVSSASIPNLYNFNTAKNAIVAVAKKFITKGG